MTCMTILDNYFLEVNPIHLRRKQFFGARQKEGKSIIEFHNELLSHMDEADGANIGVNDLISMMPQIGTSDSDLQRELGAIRNTTLKSINNKIEGYEQARKTTASTAFENAASKATPQHRLPAGAQNKSNPRPSYSHGRGERDRRLALHGHSFRCAKEDHLLPQCSYPCDVKCHLCSATGHITPACSRRQNVHSIQQLPHSSSTAASQQLALTYDGNFTADGASSWISSPSAPSASLAASRAGAFYTPANRPTPEMPL